MSHTATAAILVIDTLTDKRAVGRISVRQLKATLATASVAIVHQQHIRPLTFLAKAAIQLETKRHDIRSAELVIPFEVQDNKVQTAKAKVIDPEKQNKLLQVVKQYLVAELLDSL
jgi:predicted ATP-grasp superfamily ATP-dependent carboligase